MRQTKNPKTQGRRRKKKTFSITLACFKSGRKSEREKHDCKNLMVNIPCFSCLSVYLSHLRWVWTGRQTEQRAVLRGSLAQEAQQRRQRPFLLCHPSSRPWKKGNTRWDWRQKTRHFSVDSSIFRYLCSHSISASFPCLKVMYFSI